MRVLLLLATQILRINLLTDGALALGVDPAGPDLMSKPPRPRSEGVGVVMAAGTLLIFDAALLGGLIEGAGKLEYGRTMAFTTLMLFQLFNAFNARLEVHSAFRGPLCNQWLWEAVSLSVALHTSRSKIPRSSHSQQGPSPPSIAEPSARRWRRAGGLAPPLLRIPE